jgi:SAM-dependent methyltransferase
MAQPDDPSGSVPTIRTGAVRLGDLGRTTPVSNDWGLDRGTPVDRVYIDGFLERHASDVRGRVLEVGTDFYTLRYGGDEVVVSDVLHVTDGAPGATIIADLASAEHIPSDLFDCIILTQTLQYIYETRAALATLRRILRPGGVLLATFPGIAQIDTHASEYHTHWSFTSRSARRLFSESFAPAATQIDAHGNVLVAIAFLHGLAAEELTPADFAARDEAYELIITARAVKEAA